MPAKLRSSLRPGSVIGAGLLMSAGVVLIASLTAVYMPTDPPTPGSRVSGSTLLLAKCARAGLTAETLTAAGVPASQFAEVINAAKDYYTQHAAELQQVEPVSSATADRSGGTRDAGQNATRKARRDAFFDAILNAATASLTGEQRTALQNIRRNLYHKLPIKYLTVQRTEAEWNALGNALTDKAIALRENRTPPDSVTAVLASADANSTVAAAGTRINNDLAAARQTWQDALASAAR